MKKLMVSLVASLTLFLGVNINVSKAENVKPVNNPKMEAEIAQLQAELFVDEIVKVKKAHGFIVLDQKEKANRTTVVAKITKVNSRYTFVTNIFNNKDTIVLDKNDAKGLKVGGIVLVTFNQDDVEKVKKNTLNIENKVIGQKINKKVDVFTYKIGAIDGNLIFGQAISDYSTENTSVVLDKKQFKDTVKKGDIVLVTFAHGIGDDIKSVRKLK